MSKDKKQDIEDAKVIEEKPRDPYEVPEKKKQKPLKEQVEEHNQKFKEIIGYALLGVADDGSVSAATTYPTELVNLLLSYHFGSILDSERGIVKIISTTAMNRFKEFEEQKAKKDGKVVPIGKKKSNENTEG